MSDYKDVAEWYDEKYKNTGEDTRRSVKAFKQIVDLLEVSDTPLLDVGCGRGEFLEHLHEGGFDQLAAVDLSEEAILWVKKILPNCDAKIAKGESMPFDNDHFGSFTCLGVLEHFLDIPGGLKEMNRVTKTGGKAVIMVPNLDFWGWKFRKEENIGTQQREISETLYSLSDWKNLIENAGFEVKGIQADRGFIYNNYDLKNKGSKYYLKRILRLLMPLIPVKYSYQIIFHAEKRIGI